LAAPRGYKIKPMKNSIILMLLVFLAVGCGNSGESIYESFSEDYEGVGYSTTESELKAEYKRVDQEEMISSDVEVTENLLLDQKIIKEGSITFQTDTIAKTKGRIDSIVKSLKGFCSSEVETHYTYQDQVSMTIRIPAQNFEKLIDQISIGVSHFDSKEISAEDVTEEFIDLSARIKTKKETEQRYREILRNAKTVSEILEIEEQISYLRSDIESLEGRLKYIRNRVGLSTLNITFYVEVEGGPKQGYSHKFAEGFENGWDGFILFFVALTYFWPFLLIGLIIFWFVRRKIRSRRAKKSAAAQVG